ncbi:MAG: type II secretion system GspH family protein [Microthrixaceae bacterium]|nr:type II secretion system protein [Microthrixaceae bacterium]MCO5314166.1 type II secretion system GspH family protein [Microthrixaceae bacterium]
MNKLQQRVQQRGQGGFTLIELLVVIAILAILAGVVVFAVGNSTKNASITACQTEGASLVTAASAAKTANLVNTTPEDIHQYLDKASVAALNSSLKYFSVASDLATATPTTGAVFTRTNTGKVSTTDCPAPGAVLP